MMNPIELILSIIYDLIMFAVWCFGVFAFSATRTERRNRELSRNQYTWATVSTIGLVFIAGVLWPIGIPLWFAWRKGEFIDRAIAARDKESE